MKALVDISVSPLKKCTKCLTRKHSDEFYKRGDNGKPGSHCKECVRSQSTVWRRKNPEKVRATNKKWGDFHREEKAASFKTWRDNINADPLKRAEYLQKKKDYNNSDHSRDRHYKCRFGITLNDVNNMLSKQNGMCANLACGQEISLDPTGEQKKAVVDHCHQTGKVRGMLCGACNSFLGFIEKDKRLVPGLLDYLSDKKGQ